MVGENPPYAQYLYFSEMLYVQEYSEAKGT